MKGHTIQFVITRVRTGFVIRREFVWGSPKSKGARYIFVIPLN